MAPVHAPPIREPGDTIVAKLHVWINGFFAQLPNIAAAIVFLLLCYGLARLASWGVRSLVSRRQRLDLGQLLGSIAFGAVMLLGLMIAAAIVFPSVKPDDILATLGIGSVAVGFAFKDILQNLFAGLLLLTRRPFHRGDQIVVGDYEGTVEHIESRATLIKTYDGRRVIIPNADIYTGLVMVNTAFPVRRSEVDFGIGYNDDLVRTGALIAEALGKVEGVVAEPAPDVIPVEFRDGDILCRARWWTDSQRTHVVHTRARAIDAILQTVRANGIDLPVPTQIVLLHDRTGRNEDDRAEQRLRGREATVESGSAA
jgi:small-conductance mechanosensitive channel